MSKFDAPESESPIVKLARGESVWITVQGGSMTPLLRSGDRVRVTPDRHSELQPGQIVLALSASGQFVVHRVVSQTGNTVTLRGDARPAPDPPLARSQVLGIVDEGSRGKRRIPLADSGLPLRVWSGVLHARHVWQRLRMRLG